MNPVCTMALSQKPEPEGDQLNRSKGQGSVTLPARSRRGLRFQRTAVERSRSWWGGAHGAPGAELTRGGGCEGSGRTQAPHVRRESAVVAGGLRAQGPYSKGNIRGTPREEDVRHTGGREDAGSPPPWAGRGFRRQPSDQGGAGRCGRGAVLPGKRSRRANKQQGGSAGPPGSPPNAVPPTPAATSPGISRSRSPVGEQARVRLGLFLQV